MCHRSVNSQSHPTITTGGKIQGNLMPWQELCVSNKAEIEGSECQQGLFTFYFLERLCSNLYNVNTNGLYTFSFSEEKAQMEWQKLTLFLSKIKQYPAPSHPQKHKTTYPSASNSWLWVSSSKQNWKSPAPRKSVLGSGEALYRSWESSMGSEGSDSFPELWHRYKTKQKHFTNVIPCHDNNRSCYLQYLIGSQAIIVEEDNE